MGIHNLEVNFAVIKLKLHLLLFDGMDTALRQIYKKKTCSQLQIQPAVFVIAT